MGVVTVSVIGRLRQEDFELEANLDYITDKQEIKYKTQTVRLETEL